MLFFSPENTRDTIGNPLQAPRRVYEQVHHGRRRNGLTPWDQAQEELLRVARGKEVAV